MSEDLRIIEVDVRSERLDTPAKKQVKRADVDGHAQKIERYRRLAIVLAYCGRVPMFLFAIMGFAFSILFSQGPTNFNLVMMVLFWSLAGLAFICLMLSYGFRRLAISRMKKDPNYERYVS